MNIVERTPPSNTHIICHEKIFLISTIQVTVPASTTIHTTYDNTFEITSYVRTTSTQTLTTPDVVYTTSYTSTTATGTYTESYTSTVYLESTRVVTTTVPTKSVYAACASDNVISNLGPGNNITAYNYNGDRLFVANVTDPYSCCVKCFETTNCTGMVYDVPKEYDPYPYDQGCSLFLVRIGAVCNGSAKAEWDAYHHHETVSDNYYISNGPCGQRGGFVE